MLKSRIETEYQYWHDHLQTRSLHTVQKSIQMLLSEICIGPALKLCVAWGGGMVLEYISKDRETKLWLAVGGASRFLCLPS